MYRIMQSLERESNTSSQPGAAPKPAAQADQTTSSFGMTGIDNAGTTETPVDTPTSNAATASTAARRSNPRKYLLYRPSYAQIALYLATCFKDISDSSALLLYISADGSKRQSQTNGTLRPLPSFLHASPTPFPF